jgi:NADH-quinone oxidoreductase subunit K
MIDGCLALSLILFAIGALGFLLRRNIVAMFICVELMINAANLALVSFAASGGVEARALVFFVMAIAAAEAAVGLAIVVAAFRLLGETRVDWFDRMRG